MICTTKWRWWCGLAFPSLLALWSSTRQHSQPDQQQMCVCDISLLYLSPLSRPGRPRFLLVGRTVEKSMNRRHIHGEATHPRLTPLRMTNHSIYAPFMPIWALKPLYRDCSARYMRYQSATDTVSMHGVSVSVYFTEIPTRCGAMKIWLQLSLAILVAAGVAGVTTLRACAELDQLHNSSAQPRRWVSYLGIPRPLAVWSTPDPTQLALAHLLTRILRHLLGYEDVIIRQLNSTQDALRRLTNISHQLIPDEFVVAPGLRVKSSTPDEELAKRIERDEKSFIRAYNRPRLRLRAELTVRATADPRCHITDTDWLHFSNFTPGDCDFLLYDEIKNDVPSSRVPECRAPHVYECVWYHDNQLRAFVPNVHSGLLHRLHAESAPGFCA
ncbi:hypothetical protein EVAR_93722_1 [Eumeta japonica]|uniref:Uncharacterized protein n=1 Tax=Eumeta variegata TaxID=151549 RepID=A0A4C1U2X2_EUMVA|nr:hypothetical protein EVAR_93722_1 [Eumeta japonica]